MNSRCCFLTNFLLIVSGTSASDSRPPHIIFLLVDDLGYNNVPWNPQSITRGRLPHLQRLFQDAVHIPQAYVQRWCTPSRASLMTGRYPFRMGWNAYGGTGCMRMCGHECCPGYTAFAEELSSVPQSFELMPAMLKRGGYRTHMLGKWHLGHYDQAHTPVGRGFDSFFGFLLGSETHDTHNSWGRHTCGLPVTDLYNSTTPAKDSWHQHNLTYSPEMYATEMRNLIHDHATTHPNDPFFLYMALQNNHAPYTIVPEYDRRFQEASANGSMKNVYNGDMAAVDDAVGKMAEALAAHPGVFGNRTLIVFSQDNGGPAKMANNLPLRGAKFGVYEGGVRSNSFVWGPGVLPGQGERSYNGMLHLSDYWTTFAAIAGVNVTDAGPPGFERPDGVNQWPALMAAAAGDDDPAHYPRGEVPIDINMAYGGKPLVALRLGDYKIIYGAVGVADVIPDEDFPCADCCKLRRPGGVEGSSSNRPGDMEGSSPNRPGDVEGSSPNMCTSQALGVWNQDTILGVGQSLLPSRHAQTQCVDREHACVFNVVADVNETHNLFLDTRYAAVVKKLLDRVDFWVPRTFNRSIDHTNYTAEQYCDIVRRDQWVQPFGMAPPPPPFGPVTPTAAAEITGTWQQPNNETITMQARAGSSTVHITALHCPGCCWSSMTATAACGDTRVLLHVEEDLTGCTPIHRNMIGTLEWGGSAGNGTVKWKDAVTGKMEMKVWKKQL